MNRITSLTFLDMKNIRRDPLLSLILFLPLLIGLLMRAGIPPLTRWLSFRFGFDFAPYHPFLLIMLMLFPPMMTGWVTGFLLLDEKEGGLTPTLRITPLPERITGIGRLLWTVPFSFILSIALVLLSGLGKPEIKIIPVAFLASLEAPPTALLLCRIARNRVQGLTLAKGLSLTLAAPAAAFFLPDPWKWAAGIIPMFWPAEIFSREGSELAIIFACGLIIHLLILLPFLFKRTRDGSAAE